MRNKYQYVLLIILGFIVVILFFDLLDLIAMNYKFGIISYIILFGSLLLSLIKIKIPHKEIISFVLGIITFTSVIITHFILVNNPYTFHYEVVDGGVKITGYIENIDSYYKKIYIEIPSHIKGQEVKVIGEEAFDGSNDIFILDLPSTVEIIEDDAFKHSRLYEINLPNRLRNIGENAFYGTIVPYVTIPNTVEEISPSSFSPETIIIVGNSKINNYTPHLNKVYFNSIGVNKINNVDYVLHKDLTATVSKIYGSGKVEILEEVVYNDKTYTVTKIDFKSATNSSIEEVVIPNTITEIGYNAFSFCQKLTKIRIPSSVVSMNEEVFYNSPNVNVVVEHTSKPEGWVDNWNGDARHVSWGVAEDMMFTFTPSISGTYVITTNNSSTYTLDVEIIDYDFEIKKTTINYINVSLEAYFKKGVTYKIKVTNNETNVSDVVGLNYEFKPQELSLGDNIIDLLYDEYCYKFVPKYDTYYNFTADDNECYIYDEEFNIQSTQIPNYSLLEKGKTYYIIINKEHFDDNMINIVAKDNIKIEFYDNISSSKPLETMWYSTVSKEELYEANREHYNFIGWTTYEGTLISDIEEYVIENNLGNYIDDRMLKLYAKWEVKVYNVNYHGINGEIIKSDTYTDETGFYLDNTITIENYIILSWLDQDGKVLNEYHETRGNIDCYPNYVKEKSIITFDVASNITDGIEATLSYDVDWIEVEYNKRLVLPVPSVDGFEFVGWYNGSCQVTSNDGTMFHDITFSDDTVLVAKWVRTEYNFDIDENNI